jgi:hypothetical protein
LSLISHRLAPKQLILLLSVGSILLTPRIMASENRLDLRLEHAPISERLQTPRLELGALKEKETELAVTATRKRTSRGAVAPKVSRARLQRKEKTRKVVASQQ